MPQVSDIFARIRLDSVSLGGDVQKSNAHLAKLREGFSGLSALASRYLLAVGAAVALSVKRFGEGEQSQARLRSALAANGAEVDRNLSSYRAFAEQLKAVTTLGLDEVATLQTLALNLGVSADRVDDVVKAGVGLGERFFGGDFEQGVKAAALATQGQVRELQRMIPALRQAGSLTQLLNEVNGKAGPGFKQAKDEVNTFDGSMKILGRDVDEARKAIGEAFAPEVTKAARLIEHITAAIEAMTPAQKASLVKWVEYSTAAAGAVVATSQLVRVGTPLVKVFTAVAAASGAVAAPAAAITAALVGIGYAFVELAGKGDTFAARLENVWARALAFTNRFTDGLSTHWDQAWDGIVLRFYQAQAAMFGGDANKNFAQYLQDQEKAAKEYAARMAKEKKADLDNQANLQKAAHARMMGEETASFKSAEGVYKDIQLAILKDQKAALDQGVKAKEQAKAKENAIDANTGKPGAPAAPAAPTAPTPVAGGTPPPAGNAANNQLAKARGQENAAIQRMKNLDTRITQLRASRDDSTDPEQTERDIQKAYRDRADADVQRQAAVDQQRALTGENPLTSGIDQAKAAARAKRAAQAVKSDQQKIDSLDTQLSGDQGDNDDEERRSARAQLVRKREHDQYLADHGGVDRANRPFSLDELVPRKAGLADLLKQAKARRSQLVGTAGNGDLVQGLNKYIKDRQAELGGLNQMLAAAKKAGVENSVQTPADRQAAQFGADLSDSAKKIAGAAETIQKIFGPGGTAQKIGILQQ